MTGYRPQSYPLRLIVNGIEISSLIRERIISATLSDERDGMVDQFDIDISNTDGLIEQPPAKATLQVYLPTADGAWVDKGEFHVDTSELSVDEMTIHITARSADITDSLKVRREESYDNTTLGTILLSIAGRNSLTAAISSAMAAVVVEHIDQTLESDLAFIDRLGIMYDAVAAVKNGYLLFKEAGSATTVSGSNLPAVTVAQKGSRGGRYVEEAQEYTGVTGYWNDTGKGERIEISVGTNINPLVLRGTYRDEQQCRNAVDGRWAQVQRAVTRFSVTLPLDPTILPDCPVRWASDMPKAVRQQTMVVRRVTHAIGNYPESRIECELQSV